MGPLCRLAAVLCLLAAACGPPDPEPRPESVTTRCPSDTDRPGEDIAYAVAEGWRTAVDRLCGRAPVTLNCPEEWDFAGEPFTHDPDDGWDAVYRAQEAQCGTLAPEGRACPDGRLRTESARRYRHDPDWEEGGPEEAAALDEHCGSVSPWREDPYSEGPVFTEAVSGPDWDGGIVPYPAPFHTGPSPVPQLRVSCAAGAVRAEVWYVPDNHPRVRYQFVPGPRVEGEWGPFPVLPSHLVDGLLASGGFRLWYWAEKWDMGKWPPDHGWVGPITFDVSHAERDVGPLVESCGEGPPAGEPAPRPGGPFNPAAVWEGVPVAPESGAPYDRPAGAHGGSCPEGEEADHVVPLKEAVESGLGADRLAEFNAHPGNLRCLPAGANASKGGSEPHEWMSRPVLAGWLEESGEFCGLVLVWAGVKAEWGMAADELEHREVAGFLAGECAG